MKRRCAVIGTGISGMASAYYLRDHFDLTVYEANPYVGGHTNTVDVSHDGEEVSFDTGFMVFNEQTYPQLTRLFRELSVPVMKSDMSFSVQNAISGLEYCGSGVRGLFAQRMNWMRPRHYRFLLEIHRFNRICREVYHDSDLCAMTVGEYALYRKFSASMLHDYLIPMSSAVWSTPPDVMLDFPIATLVRFFDNHGFLGLNTQHQWYTIIGGSRTYRDRIIDEFKERIQVSQPVRALLQVGDKAAVELASGEAFEFDLVIVAAHGDEALGLMKEPTDLMKQVLSRFRFTRNVATVHTDTGVMPKTRSAWSAWNYRYDDIDGAKEASTVYYMNRLQDLKVGHHYFISINGERLIDPDKVLKRIEYTHPIFDTAAVEAQKRIPELNSEGCIRFVGAYQRYGFHEDGLWSAQQVCQRILQEAL